MRYAPPGLCLNDFEIYQRGDEYHLIHLQGPPVNPFDAAILETSYGHAVSKDLISWETRGPVFGISSYPHFDDSAVWTMSILEHESRLWMFYTGLTREPRFLQQIGLATNGTGTCEKWDRFSEKPIVSADPKFYQTSGFMAWRDPFVIYDPEDRNWKMYICAKTVTGEEHKQGCIGYAVSDNLTDWNVKQPVIAPGRFAEMECPVVFHHGGMWYMLVSVGDDRKIHAYRSEFTSGPFSYIGTIAPVWNYAPRVVRDPDGELVLLHTVPRKWHSTDEGEYLRGRLAQPKLLKFDDKGSPYLCWYPALERYYTPSEAGNNNLLVASVPPDFKSLSVRTRMQDEEKGVELTLNNDRLILQYMEDGYELASVDVSGHPPATEIKLLTYNEYYEVYLDDKLALTALGYRHLTGHSRVTADGDPHEFDIYACTI